MKYFKFLIFTFIFTLNIHAAAIEDLENIPPFGTPAAHLVAGSPPKLAPVARIHPRSLLGDVAPLHLNFGDGDSDDDTHESEGISQRTDSSVGSGSSSHLSIHSVPAGGGGAHVALAAAPAAGEAGADAMEDVAVIVQPAAAPVIPAPAYEMDDEDMDARAAAALEFDAEQLIRRKTNIRFLSHKYDLPGFEHIQESWRKYGRGDYPHFGWVEISRSFDVMPHACNICGAPDRALQVALHHPDFPELGIINVGNICASFLTRSADELLRLAEEAGIIL